MALKQRIHLSRDETNAVALTLCDPIGFARHVMPQRITIPESRTDLPESYRGKIVLSHEQRLMALDGMWFALTRWRRPEVAVGSRKVMARTARKTAKTTLGYELRYCWISAINPVGRRVEAMLHAPNEVHLAPVETRIAAIIADSPLLRSLFRGKNEERGIWTWKTGITWHHRIEGEQRDRAGRNMVGIVATAVLGDEGGYSRAGAYTERKQVAVPDCVEFWGGVPRPVEFGIFKEIAARTWEQMERGEKPVWSIHGNPPMDSPLWKTRHQRYDMRANPLFHSDKAYLDQLGTGTWDTDDNKTQVLGLDGASGSRAFNSIPRAPVPFYFVRITDNDVSAGTVESILSSIPFAEMEEQAEEWRFGIDYGFNPSPMVVIVFYRHGDIWYEYARIEALRCDTFDAAKIVHVLDSCLPYLTSSLGIDTHGQGRGLGDTLCKSPLYSSMGYSDRLVHAGFNTSLDDTRSMTHRKCRSAVTLTDSQAKIYMCATCTEYVDESEVMPRRVQAKEILTTDIMEAFSFAERRFSDVPTEEDGWGLVLAYDDVELLSELEGTVAVQASKVVRFEPPDGNGHSTDAIRAFAMTMRSDGGYDATRLAPIRLVMEEFGAYDFGTTETSDTMYDLRVRW